MADSQLFRLQDQYRSLFLHYLVIFGECCREIYWVVRVAVGSRSGWEIHLIGSDVEAAQTDFCG
ncbi:hypothetical protein Lalb_Chr20g0113591 [Lupinus albus]|uniref:Uncharacterized protein n=1 Tax=Lupinus albus TaxID=3870 RepID=A0A6A4NB94_LUPAL|nr:hypothetical protein Lalb_Chr20g0113591 [Lupinus albus]